VLIASESTQVAMSCVSSVGSGADLCQCELTLNPSGCQSTEGASETTQANGALQLGLKGAKLSAVLFWLRKCDGQPPLCKKVTGGTNVAVVGMGDRGLLEVEGGVGGGKPVLREQLLVLRRRQLWPRVSDGDRRFWILASRWFTGWQDILVVVRAATVLRWYRRGWRAYWRWRSRRGAKAGRHPGYALDQAGAKDRKSNAIVMA
jgi:hypothetical protein